MIRGRLALYIFTNSFQFSVKSLLSLKRKFTSFPQAAKAACGVLSGERPGRPAGKTIGVEPGDLRPVHQLPPSLEVVSPPVLVLEVVGVLPHVTAQQGHQRQGRVLVGGLLDGQTALPVGGQPGPAGAELSQGCLPHGGLQPRQTAEGPEDGPLQRRFGGGGRQGVEGAEVQAVVVYAPGVVPDALAELLRQRLPAETQLPKRPGLIGRRPLQQLIQGVHIGGEVLVVVKAQHLFVQLRLQGVIAVGQGRQGKGVVLFQGDHPFRREETSAASILCRQAGAYFPNPPDRKKPGGQTCPPGLRSAVAAGVALLVVAAAVVAAGV